MKKNILVAGGAGYIGSHIAYLLAAHDYQVVIFDSFVYDQEFSPSWATVVKGEIADTKLVQETIKKYDINAIVHCAARIEVGRSVTDPADFYQTNLIDTALFFEAARKSGVKTYIFSSSCAVYGDPVTLPLHESHSKNPLNPYGKTKRAIEWLLEDYAQAYDIQYVTLRYFNASGALPEVGIGECHDPETHLIPLAIDALQTQRPLKIFGTDYSTPDGTAIRDYVHVIDIAKAHIQALEHLDKTAISGYFNLGTGEGHSVKKVIETIESISGKKVPILEMPRREGDTAILVADAEEARRILNWKPEHSSLEFIIQSALKWELIRFHDQRQKKIIVSVA
ncbi:UDP-glucose 4-epimerase GalE [Candidatus Babeliales bacterium]|nr:UDP-glucose 4-epimerase GalE [Candidatus Babeliales bacterium]